MQKIATYTAAAAIVLYIGSMVFAGDTAVETAKNIDRGQHIEDTINSNS